MHTHKHADNGRGFTRVRKFLALTIALSTVRVFIRASVCVCVCTKKQTHCTKPRDTTIGEPQASERTFERFQAPERVAAVRGRSGVRARHRNRRQRQHSKSLKSTKI